MLSSTHSLITKASHEAAVLSVKVLLSLTICFNINLKAKKSCLILCTFYEAPHLHSAGKLCRLVVHRMDDNLLLELHVYLSVLLYAERVNGIVECIYFFSIVFLIRCLLFSTLGADALAPCADPGGGRSLPPVAAAARRAPRGPVLGSPLSPLLVTAPFRSGHCWRSGQPPCHHAVLG